MFKIRFLIGLTALAATMSLALLPRATAQSGQPTTPTNQSNFEGRGIAQGSAFTRGRNATVSLMLDRDNFGLEITERGGESPSSGNRARVQYRGTLVRQPNISTNSNSFTVNGRIRSVTSSANLRPLNNTTGTCRIEVFDARVVSSTCNAVTADGSTNFLGLEQF